MIAENKSISSSTLEPTSEKENNILINFPEIVNKENKYRKK
jgi:hypothetical protein